MILDLAIIAATLAAIIVACELLQRRRRRSSDARIDAWHDGYVYASTVRRVERPESAYDWEQVAARDEAKAKHPSWTEDHARGGFSA